tara:strand:+ start:322 stop:651 length:330 start_codon:yes stop_codon:yes gene_type:complete
MYYVYSLICAIVIFVILQKSYNKNDDTEKDKTFEQLFTFAIIYGILTLCFYFLTETIFVDKTDSLDTSDDMIGGTGGKSIKSNIDVNMLRKIPEEVNTGFSINDLSDGD